MATQSKRATVYFNPELHKALKLKAVETSRSVSELVNDAVRNALAEDVQDLSAFEGRAGEPLISYDEMAKRLKKHGRIQGLFPEVWRASHFPLPDESPN